MLNNQLKICLPWNSKNYVPVNAFHPLYSFLLENSRNKTSDKTEVEYVTMNEMGWKDYLTKTENRETIFSYVNSVFKKLPCRMKKEFHDFWTFFDVREAIVDEIYDYDFKLVHTSLMACNLKPFVFHLESFETLFFPWQIQNPYLEGLSSTKVQAIKQFLQNILEKPTCMAIVSHVPLTVKRIKEFFGSEIINKKLFHSPLGIACPENISEKFEKQKQTEQPRRFLFTSSLHGNSDNLTKRGLVSFILFILEWKKHFPQDQFVFLSKEPAYEFVAPYLAYEQFHEVVAHENVLFTGGAYVSDGELTTLLKKTDYVFLLTYQLHSISLLKSMAYGAVPIVMNLPEIMDYGINDDNAVILNCFDNLSFDANPYFDRLPNLDSYINKTNEGVPSLVSKLLNIRNNPEQERQLQMNAHETIKTKFDPEKARNSLNEIMFSGYQQFQNEHSTTSTPALPKFPAQHRFGSLKYFLPAMRTVNKSDFDRRTTFYESIALGVTSIYEDGQSSLEIACGATYSPLQVGRFNLHENMQIFEAHKPNMTHESAVNNAFMRVYTMTNVNEPIVVKLKKYVIYRPALKKILRPIYRTYKKVLRI